MKTKYQNNPFGDFEIIHLNIINTDSVKKEIEEKGSIRGIGSFRSSSKGRFKTVNRNS